MTNETNALTGTAQALERLRFMRSSLTTMRISIDSCEGSLCLTDEIRDHLDMWMRDVETIKAAVSGLKEQPAS